MGLLGRIVCSIMAIDKKMHNINIIILIRQYYQKTIQLRHNGILLKQFIILAIIEYYNNPAVIKVHAHIICQKV